MKKVATLTKPYKNNERIDFIVNYNHNIGLKIEETETELQAWDFDDEEKLEQRKQQMRALRNSYLVKYVDPKQLVLVWNSLTEEDQKEYTDYRQYLLDYPETEGWYEKNPMTFKEWKEKIQEPIEQEENESGAGDG